MRAFLRREGIVELTMWIRLDVPDRSNKRKADDIEVEDLWRPAPIGLKLCANRLWIALVYLMLNTLHVYCILCHHYWMLPKRQKTCSDGAVDMRKMVVDNNGFEPLLELHKSSMLTRLHQSSMYLVGIEPTTCCMECAVSTTRASFQDRAFRNNLPCKPSTWSWILKQMIWVEFVSIITWILLINMYRLLCDSPCKRILNLSNISENFVYEPSIV